MNGRGNEALVEAFDKTEPEFIRNVCIIAHVDHGKTCLADYLVSSNGIISARLAGKMRYMDSREDEQVRGITMKSSAITLYHSPIILNLIDSPGHVDFSSEVNSALVLSDIALLVVDVVEGVCSQTEALLRQAVFGRLDIILVLNKMDRLVVEVKQTPEEAFRHIRCLIEQINSCLSQIVHGQLVEEEWCKFEETERSLHFDPAKGNVIFSSAVRGYGFSVDDFATLWAPKLNIDAAELRASLFSDSYVAGPGRIKPDAERLGKKTLFEQLVLQPMWEVHKHGLIEPDVDRLKAIAEKMGVKSLRSRRAEEAFDEFMRLWMPLSRAAIRACAKAKSAKRAYNNEERLCSILGNEGVQHPLFPTLKQCDADNETTVLFVAKILRTAGHNVAMCRVMSGTVKTGDRLFVTHEKRHVPADSDDEEKENHENGVEVPQKVAVTVKAVFILMGRELIPCSSAKAGAVCAVEADTWIPGTTLCSDENIEVGLDLNVETSEPLVRVSIQPTGGPESWDELRAALKQLNVLDASVRVVEQENGELALVTAGEVHLQKCLQDLEDMGQMNVMVSEPIVPFLETIIPDSTMSFAKIVALQKTECNLRSGQATITLRAAPICEEVVTFMQKHEHILKEIREGICNHKRAAKFMDELKEVCVEKLPVKGTWWAKQPKQRIEALVDRIWAFGPPRARFNILFNAIESYDRPAVWTRGSKRLRPLDATMVAGFDLSMATGPLCEEAVQGVAIIVESWTLDETDLNDPTLTGQMISAMKQTCRAAINKHPLRLVAALYRVMVQTNAVGLGKVHPVLSQRRAKVVNEDVNQATGLFEIEALMPIIESFNFCEQLRKKTSGLASAQLFFAQWQMIDEDPFWEPTTQDEIEHYGTKGDSINQARLYMDNVRRRKGLMTDEVIVVNAEKQRNLKRNK
uniref:Elongation factor-like 1 n=1 Tax=Steinernema glaseri TaxID=37863 RepID=A0A1I7Y724_9BILA